MVIPIQQSGLRSPRYKKSHVFLRSFLEKLHTTIRILPCDRVNVAHNYTNLALRPCELLRMIACVFAIGAKINICTWQKVYIFAFVNANLYASVEMCF